MSPVFDSLQGTEMSKHVVILLHGMGTQTKGWSAEAVSALKKNATAIKYPRSMTDDFEFIEINYGHLFDEYVDQHNKNAESLAGLMTSKQIGAASSFFRGLFEYGASSLSKEDFVVSALGDVFLYRLSEYSEVVRTFIIKEITKTLNDKGRPQWSVIAHSLGTRVIHDALDDFLEDGNNRAIFKKPVSLSMISNVVHLLAYSPSKLWRNTGVWPDKRVTKGACFRYMTALHPADPFTWIREFDPTPDWGDNAEYGGQYFQAPISFKEISRPNTHSFTGYLENPKVSAAVCWALGRGNSFDPVYDQDALIRRTAKYAKNTVNGNVEKVWKKARKLRDERNLTAFREVVGAIDDLEKFIGNFGDSLFD